MDLSENTLTILNIFLTALIAIITSVITSKYSAKPEKQKTSRIMFDVCYSKIYSLVEYDLYSENITLEQVQAYGSEIVSICDGANNYFFPSVKVHAEWLRDSTESNYKETWLYFSKRFSLRYDTSCKDIGLPLRNKSYRINRNHYVDKWEHFKLNTLSEWPYFLFISITILILLILNINS